MGAIGSGKTNFVNTASGGKLPPVGDSDGLRSRTTSIQTSPTFTVEGRSVVLIDLPGFDETTTRGVDVLSTVSVFLAEMYESDKKLAGIIYLHRISESFRMFQELCGSESLKNVVIATTGWSEVPLEVAEAREHELMSNDLFFKSVLDGGARMVRYDNTTESAHSVLGALVEKEPLPLLIQTQVVDDNKTLAETAAGAELDVAISLMIAKLEQWIPLVKEEAER
ncbi:hypothetical protein L218DRAFT_975735 [Marasmius fiardii PR-910]|nr:hypothetical protein L218DRAFT_975735 [Marasmius fiardii PR-910]